MMDRFNVSRWAVGHPALVSFMMACLFLAGGYGFFHLGRAEDPAFTLKNMIVSAQWPGAGAQQMQRQVAEPLEQGLRDIEAIDVLSTYCVPAACVTQIFLRDDERKERVPVIWQQVRNRLSDLSPNLPSGVALAANDDYADVYGYVFALTGGENADLIKTSEYLKKIFQAVHGVGKVQISGEIPQQVTVDLDPQQAAARGISLDQVARSLQGRSALASGGSVDFTTVVPLNVSGALGGVRSVEDTPLAGHSGTMRVKDIARVSRDYADPAPSLIRYGGRPAVVIAVAMADGADGLALGRALEKAAAAAVLPAGMTLTQVEDQSRVIREAVDTFLIKFVVALSVVLLVAFVSLGLKAGIIVACSVPLTLAGVSLYMGMEHIGLDRISLGALILSLGLLVDDAIISIEAMIVQLEQGRSREEAASFAWSHTAFPMLTGTVLTVVSFLPVGLAQSTTGEYAGEIFWVSAAALLFSWVVAVVFIPFLGVHLLPEAKQPSQASRESRLAIMLRHLLGTSLRYKKNVAGGTIMLLIVACGGFMFVDQQFFPQSDRPEVIVDVAMPPGTAIGETDAAVGIVEKHLAGSPSLRHMEAHIGDGAPRFYLPYAPATPSAAHATLLLVAQDLDAREQLIQQVEAISMPAGVHLHVQRLSLGPTADFPVQYRIIGPDPDTLRAIARNVDEILRGTEGAVSVQADWGNRTPSLTLEADPDKLAYFQTDRVSVAAQLQAAISGEVAGDIPDGHHHIPVMVRAARPMRSDPGLWTNLPIVTGTAVVPLGQLGAIRMTTDFPILWQRNGELCMTVQSGVATDIQPATVVQRATSAIETLRKGLPAGYRIETGGDVELSSTADSAIFAFLPLTGGLMLLALMIQLQSFSRSLLVLFSAPLGLIGMVSGLLVTGAPFGFVALLGLIALAGMIMRNTILLVDQIQSSHQGGTSLHAAIIDATLTRARPVCLTAVAAILAFIPLSFNVFWGPMAIVMIGGLVGGTALTLIAVPAFYAVLFDRTAATAEASAHA
ncbi:efflux RND transporter permease subunit [Komagataeibacter melaceti]|uniref:Efflux RND transporter permease subunit n=1 Tax=Komagataeibacter melaceti TaxID=2766577 RepID=A0A371YYJ5_9PROT|nr:efflux RND transporter permease subunit [Komagataeibacter melaceti]RFD19303.1 efflux RND transporter permease subunit [Komagataeibacter melaceti]